MNIIQQGGQTCSTSLIQQRRKMLNQDGEFPPGGEGTQGKFG